MAQAFVPKERAAGETRVAATPETVARLVRAGFEVLIEDGAGAGARISDAEYERAGARITGESGWGAELVLKVAPPSLEEAARLGRASLLVGLVQPARNLDLVARLRERETAVCALDLLPRTGRTQAMDALASQATVAGYKAVLLGAAHLGRICPLLITSAGTLPAARVVVLGAGVAGLQAIATARRLGCVVLAADVTTEEPAEGGRLAAKEQVETLGARFIDRAEVKQPVAEADLVILAADVPGKEAPLLVDESLVRSMRPGSVIVDLAVESGGSCALSERGAIVERHGVTLVGLENLPATMPQHASELYARNVCSFVELLVDAQGRFAPPWADEVLKSCLLVRGGAVRHGPTARALSAAGAVR